MGRYGGLPVKLSRCNVDTNEHCVRLFDSDAPTIGRVVGHVRPIYRDSHIRRGRLQASPWWQASDVKGNPIDAVVATRREAIALVVDHAPVSGGIS